MDGTPIDLEKMRSIGYLPRGRTRNRVKEYRRKDGVRVKETTDELNNTVRESNVKGDRVDVTVRPATVHSKSEAKL